MHGFLSSTKFSCLRLQFKHTVLCGMFYLQVYILVFKFSVKVNAVDFLKFSRVSVLILCLLVFVQAFLDMCYVYYITSVCVHTYLCVCVFAQGRTSVAGLRSLLPIF